MDSDRRGSSAITSATLSAQGWHLGSETIAAALEAARLALPRDPGETIAAALEAARLALPRAPGENLSRLLADSVALRPIGVAESLSRAVQDQIGRAAAPMFEDWLRAGTVIRSSGLQSALDALQESMAPMLDVYAATLPLEWVNTPLARSLDDLTAQAGAYQRLLAAELDLGTIPMPTNWLDALGSGLSAVPATVAAERWEPVPNCHTPDKHGDSGPDGACRSGGQDHAFLVALVLVLYLTANAPGWIAQRSLGRPLTYQEQFWLVQVVYETISAAALAIGLYRGAQSARARFIRWIENQEDPPTGP